MMCAYLPFIALAIGIKLKVRGESIEDGRRWAAARTHVQPWLGTRVAIYANCDLCWKKLTRKAGLGWVCDGFGGAPEHELAVRRRHQCARLRRQNREQLRERWERRAAPACQDGLVWRFATVLLSILPRLEPDDGTHTFRPEQ